MVAIKQRIRTWSARRLFGHGRGTPDLSTLRVLPRSVTMPLRRDGLDPIAELTDSAETAPVRRLANIMGLRVWLVSGYDAARTVLADTQNYSNDIRGLIGKADTDGADAIGGLGFTDPPDHTRLRKYLTPEFTRRRLARLQPRIDEIVADQLDQLDRSDGPVDLVENFALPIPFRVICELLGLSEMDRKEFARLGAARFDASGGTNGLLGSASSTREFLIHVVSEQRRSPGDGLIGSLVRDHGDEMDDVELGGLADGLFLGGYETSASMLALGTLTLAQHRDTYRELGRDPSNVEAVVQELMRLLSVVQVAFPRFARADVTLADQHIRAGDAIMCSLSTANRDKAFGPDPARFDPHRQSSASHLGFGYGAHRCVGSELALMELRTALAGLTHRFPDLTLATPLTDVAFRKLSIVYGVESLPVYVRPPASAAPADGATERPGG